MKIFCQHKQLNFILAFLCIGCVNPTLVYQHRDFNHKELDRIILLPMVDARNIVLIDPEDEDTEDYQQLIAEELQEKEYNIQVVEDPDALGDILPGQLPFLDANHIRELGPQDARWVLVPVAVSDRQPEGMWYLFDKTRGKLMWEGSGIDDDLEEAFEVLMEKFPDHD